MEQPSDLTCQPRQVISYWPAEVTLLVVKGDPFSFRLVLRDADGDPVDLSVWDLAATVTTGPFLRLDFETAGDATGAYLWLRGDQTARLPTGRLMPFDVAARAPGAGEGSMVLAGQVLARTRVTDPLRHDPEAQPGREDDLVPT